METIPHIPARKVAGIYGIIHTATFRIYIGSAINITTRWHVHRSYLLHNTHQNKYLQRAWNKYGSQAFEWVILEEVTDISQLIPLEQKWIDYYQASQHDKGFNILPNAGSPLGRPSVPRPDCAKLTEDDVRMIKARLARGDSCAVLAQVFDVSKGTIQHIKSNKIWKYVTDFTPVPGTPIRRKLKPKSPRKSSRRRLLDIDDWYKWLESTIT